MREREGEIVKAHLVKGGKRERERERGRNGARTESEGGRWGRSLLRKLATWLQR